MLTDYHVHLRPDEPDATAELTSRARTPRATARRRRSAASRSWASPSTCTASARRSTSGSTRSGARTRSTTSTPTASSSASETDLPLGIEADFVPGREDRMANLLDAREWDYVIGSVHFLRDEAVDMRGDWDSGGRADPGEGLAALLRDARRGGAQRPVRHPRAPRPREGLGRRAAAARRRPAPLLRSGDGRDRRVRRRDRGVHRRAAQAGRRDLPGAPRSSRCASRRAGPIALSSDAHVPEHLGLRYDDALELLASSGREELAVFERPRAAAGAARMSRRAPGIGLRLAPARGGPPAGARRGRDPGARARASRATRTPTSLTHAVIDALLGAAGLGDIGQHFPDTDERWRDADSLELLREVCTFLGDTAATVRNVDATVICEAPKLGPHRDAMRRGSRTPSGCARAREREVHARRGDGLRRPRRGHRRAGDATVERRSEPAPCAARDPHPRHAHRRSAARSSRAIPAGSGSTRAGRPSTRRIHVGNARPFVVFSLLKRFLEHEGYEVTFVANVTDVNDKIYDAARERGRAERAAGARDDRRLPRRHRARSGSAAPTTSRSRARRSTRSSR